MSRGSVTVAGAGRAPRRVVVIMGWRTVDWEMAEPEGDAHGGPGLMYTQAMSPQESLLV